MLPNYLANIKSSGIYRFVFDKSEMPGQDAETLRLVIGYSEKGPFNTPVYVTKEDDFKKIFGGTSKKMERYGMWFHKLALQALKAGPILAFNLKNFEDADEGKNMVEYTTFNPNESIFPIDIITGEIMDNLQMAVKDLYNTDRFWTLEPEQLEDYVNNTEAREQEKPNFKKGYITIATTDSKDTSVTIFLRGYEPKGYDVPFMEWYSAVLNGEELPSYLEGHERDLVSQYWAEMYIFRGQFTPDIASSDKLAKFFIVNGQDVTLQPYVINAFGEKIDTLDALASNDASNFVKKYQGILLPDFRNANNTVISLDAQVNADNYVHKLMMRFNQDMLYSIDPESEDGDDDVFTIGDLDTTGWTNGPNFDGAMMSVFDVDPIVFEAYFDIEQEQWDYDEGENQGENADFYHYNGLEPILGSDNFTMIFDDNDSRFGLTGIREGDSIFIGELAHVVKISGKEVENTSTRIESTDFDYVHDEDSWNESYQNGGLHDYYEAYPNEDLWNESQHRAANFNDKVYVTNQGNFKASWVEEDLQKITNVQDPTEEYYMHMFYDIPILPVEIFEDEALSETAGTIVINEVTYPDCIHCWEGVINAPGAKLPWIVPHFSTDVNAKIVFTYDDMAEVMPWGDTIFGTGEGHRAWGVASPGNEWSEASFVLPATGFDIDKFHMMLEPITEEGTHTQYSVQVDVDLSNDNIDLDNIYKCVGSVSATSRNVKPLYLKGYTYGNPKPNSTKQIDKRTWQEYMLKALTNYRGLRIALTSRVDLEYRYLVDTFESFVGPECKAILSTLCKEKDNAFAILNFPQMKNFSKCDYISFRNEKGEFDTKYIPMGGNPLKPMSGMFTLPSQENGASWCGFFTALKIRDLNTGVKEDVPSAALVSNNFMKKYTTYLPYTIIAGTNRGVIREPGLIGPDFNFSREDLDNLEPFGVNCMVYVDRKGTCINSNQTAKQNPVTTLSKINVRELVIFLQDEIEKLMLDYHWDFNTPNLQQRIKDRADVILETAKNNGGVYVYRNQCDKYNNTDDVINNEMFVLSTSIEPGMGAGKMVQELYIYRKGGMSSALISDTGA